MFIPPTLLQATNLIKDGSLEIYLGENSVRLERDSIQLDLSDIKSLKVLMDREDILPQMRHLSEKFSQAGKTLEIRYKNARVVRLGAGADSLTLQLLGVNHVTIGNPLTVYRFLRVWGKN